MTKKKLALATISLMLVTPVTAQNSLSSKTIVNARPSGLSYADLADLALASRITVAVKVRQATRLKGPEATNVLPGRRRFLVVADVLALIRSSESIAPRITYVIDVPPNAAGKFPNLSQGEGIVFAIPVEGYPNEVRLVSPDAQIAATPDYLARVRSILKDSDNPSAPPVIVGVDNAFHTPGAIPGEGETQIFLQTKDDRQVSLSIVRRAGQPPLWSVAAGEIVDQGGGLPQRNSLLWYRLACFLPPTLPPSSTESQPADQAQTAAEDYKELVAGLGPCPRSLRIRPEI